MITIGFTGRTRACLRTEFTPPIADDERRETLIHVALLTARTFVALSPENQLTFAGTLREWIEDQFVACPTRLVPGDPMACLPRFASTFVAPAREYALASKGVNHNGRGIEFFLPMALVSFLRHVAVTFPNPEELLKPALALCSAVVIQPLTMQTHFQAAAASLPKVPPLVDKTVAEQRVMEETVVEQVMTEEPVRRPSPRPQPAKPAITTAPARSHRARRLSWVMSATLTALLIIVGVQYFTTAIRQPQIPLPPQQEIIPPPPVVSRAPEPPAPSSIPPQTPGALPEVTEPTPPTGAPTPTITPAPPTAPSPTIAPSRTTAPPTIATPEPSTLPPLETIQPTQDVVTGAPPVAPPVELPLREPTIAPPMSQSRNVGLYQQSVHDLAEDALAQVEVMVNALEGQILTQFALSDVLAYGLRAVRADLDRLDRLIVPPGYGEKHQAVLRSVAGLARFGRELKSVRMQPAAGELQERLAALQARLDDALRAINSI